MDFLLLLIKRVFTQDDTRNDNDQTSCDKDIEIHLRKTVVLRATIILAISVLGLRQESSIDSMRAAGVFDFTFRHFGIITLHTPATRPSGFNFESGL